MSPAVSTSKTEPAYQVLSFQPHQEAQARKYITRKSHRKSRGGCLGCKLSRIKSKSPARGVSRVSLLHHINQHFHASAGLETAGGQVALLVSLGMSRPYLLDVTLAVAACHLRHMYQANGGLNAATTDTVYACRVAEHYQQSLAIRSFKQALGEPFDQEGSDSVLISSMMFNLLSFTLDDNDDPALSWVFTTAPDRLSWFSMSMGLAPLLINTKQFHEHSILRHIFNASDDEQHTFHGNDTKPLSKVPSHWLRLCGLDYGSDDPDHIFYEPVRILAELFSTPVNQESFFLYMGFFGKVGAQFRSLLEHDSEPAMWLLGYWLGLLCRFDQIWWLSARARRDYRAICIWLDKRKVRRGPGAEGLMWRQLMVELEGATQQPPEPGTKDLHKPEFIEICD
ncbi:C6 transcription factor [Cordyceps militaris]|uniref:C6 transcription factor n=1 Tax=Cordyceps militaris TaxID=73501 RepID=A0A2H4SRV3_CORMI|nr:C6 transcription factor [Cordyceps militaris]